MGKKAHKTLQSIKLLSPPPKSSGLKVFIKYFHILYLNSPVIKEIVNGEILHGKSDYFLTQTKSVLKQHKLLSE